MHALVLLTCSLLAAAPGPRFPLGTARMEVGPAPHELPDWDVQDCVECHPAQVESWRHSGHAGGREDAVFQVALTEDRPGWCVQCHAPLARDLESGPLPAGSPPEERGVTCAGCHAAIFFEADATQAQMRAKVEKTRKQEARALAACVSQCVQHRKTAAAPEGGYDCDCEGQCMGCEEAPLSTKAEQLKHQLTGGEFVLGSLAKPTAFLRGVTEESGSRESWLAFRQTLVAYTGDKASVVLTLGHAEENLEVGEPLRVHVLEWSEAGGKARLASITSFTVDALTVRVVRYRPATSA